MQYFDYFSLTAINLPSLILSLLIQTMKQFDYISLIAINLPSLNIQILQFSQQLVTFLQEVKVAPRWTKKNRNTENKCHPKKKKSSTTSKLHRKTQKMNKQHTDFSPQQTINLITLKPCVYNEPCWTHTHTQTHTHNQCQEELKNLHFLQQMTAMMVQALTGAKMPCQTQQKFK